jgi:PAS domain S-box-containing protein
LSKKPNEQDKLRKAAEAQLANASDTKQESRSAEELLYELRVNQIELEMQNEQLRQSQIALEESRDRYIAFYDFATVGYLTLAESGMIAEVNLTGAQLLGVERKKLQQYRFDHFVAPEYRDHWHRQFINVINGTSASFPLMLQRDDGSIFKAHMDCRRDENGQEKPILCITITDLTEQTDK